MSGWRRYEAAMALFGRRMEEDGGWRRGTYLIDVAYCCFTRTCFTDSTKSFGLTMTQLVRARDSLGAFPTRSFIFHCERRRRN